MNIVFLLKARPIVKCGKDTPSNKSDITLLSIYEDKELAKEELEQFKKSGKWEDFKIEAWEVKKKYDWTPLPSPYSFSELNSLI